MSSEIAIRTRGLSKCYPIFDKPQDRLKQMFVRGRRKYYRDFWAVRNVDLNVYRGETVGIVGRNGSGKSTLLQLIYGTLTPTAGELKVNGRVTGLLELGAGFNTEFTGRENVYTNAAVLGLSRTETDNRFDSIAAFADIGSFIDQPVKTYSSGMYARLAFAVAINLNPDVLIVDEALAVGDESFQRKCFARIKSLRDQGCTILFVSHAAQLVVELCDRAVLLDAGERLLTGQPKQVVSHYHKLLYAPPQQIEQIKDEIRELDRCGAKVSNIGVITTTPQRRVESIEERAEFDPHLRPKSTVEYPVRGVVIRDVHIRDNNDRRVNVLVPRQIYRYCYCVDFQVTCYFVRFGMLLKTLSGMEVAGQVSHPEGDGVEMVESGTTVELAFAFENRFMPGTYFANAGVIAAGQNGPEFKHRLIDAVMFRVKPSARPAEAGFLDLRPTEGPAVEIRRISRPSQAIDTLRG